MLEGIGPPDDSQMQAIWIGGTFLAWGLVLAGVVTWIEARSHLLGLGLAVAGLLIEWGLTFTLDWLFVWPGDE